MDVDRSSLGATSLQPFSTCPKTSSGSPPPIGGSEGVFSLSLLEHFRHGNLWDRRIKKRYNRAVSPLFCLTKEKRVT